MFAATSTHDIFLILAVILFLVAAVLHLVKEAGTVAAVLLCVGLAVFSWSFLITT